MTQAVIKNTDISFMSGQSIKHSSSGFGLADENLAGELENAFDKIYDSALLNNQPSTLGDSKESLNDGDITALILNFTDILMQPSDEVNMEKPLDSTLSKDIEETINNIKSATALGIVIDGQDLTENNAETEISIDNSSVQDIEIEDEKMYSIATKTDEIISDEEDNDDASRTGIDKDMLDELNIEAFEGESSSENMMSGQQSPEEFGMKVLLNHSLEKADIAFEKTMAPNNSQTVKAEITPEKIIEQITKQMNSLKSASSLRIVLNPESLGKVDLQIINTKEGLSAQFTVTTNEARDILMKGLDGLKESLLTQGVGVDNISVKISETEESSYNQDWTEQENSGNKHQQSRQQREEKEKGLFEKIVAENLKNENGKV